MSDGEAVSLADRQQRPLPGCDLGPRPFPSVTMPSAMQPPSHQQQYTPGLSRSPKKTTFGVASSTPNLSSLYSAHGGGRTPSISRKNSHVGLSPIPDVDDIDALRNILRESSSAYNRMAPTTPGRAATAMGDFREGDVVDVPGNMAGTVRFVGSVDGRKGTFAGIELHPEFMARGKNSGDVDG